jgi:branched-chain amino acid transport system permease protein
MSLAPLLLNGLALGAAYALIALGFVLALNAAGAVNFAHGDMTMLGGLAGALLGAWLGLPGWALLPLILVLAAGLGLAVAATGFLPLRDRPPATMFVATLALAAIFEHGATALLGAAPRSVPSFAGAGVIEVAGILVGRQAIAIIVVAIVLVGAVELLLQYTRLGRRLRAIALDREMAAALGMPVLGLILLSFMLAAALAGVAGLLLGHQFFAAPTQGPAYMVKAYIAVAIGGWGSVPGALAGALLIALFEVLVAALLDDAWAQGLLYVALLAILLLRPQGLFGEPVGRRV